MAANTNVGHATIEVNAFGPEDMNGNVKFPAWGLASHTNALT